MGRCGVAVLVGSLLATYGPSSPDEMLDARSIKEDFCNALQKTNETLKAPEN
jgi:hypothetical protein